MLASDEVSRWLFVIDIEIPPPGPEKGRPAMLRLSSWSRDGIGYKIILYQESMSVLVYVCGTTLVSRLDTSCGA